MSSTAYQYAATDRDRGRDVGLETGSPGHTPLPQNVHHANAPSTEHAKKYGDSDTSFGDRPGDAAMQGDRSAGMEAYGARRAGMTDSDMDMHGSRRTGMAENERDKHGARRTGMGDNDMDTRGNRRTGMADDDMDSYGARRSKTDSDMDTYGARRTGMADNDMDKAGARRTGMTDSDMDMLGSRRTDMAENDMDKYGARRTGMDDNDLDTHGTRRTGKANDDMDTYGARRSKDDSAMDTRFAGAGAGTGKDTRYTGSGAGMGADTLGETETVLHVESPDMKTIRVSGDGAAYTLRTTYENNNELVTIHRDEDEAGEMQAPYNKPMAAGTGTGTGMGTGMGMGTGARTGTGTGAGMGTGVSMGAGKSMGTGTASLPTAGAPVAQVEVHQLRASKISLQGGPQIKLKNWLGGRGTYKHTFEEGGKTYEWRKSMHGLAHKLELFAEDMPEMRIAWAEKLPATTQTTSEPHEAGRPPLPSSSAKAKLVLTARAKPMMDAIVVSFLLVDRESREDPLHG